MIDTTSVWFYSDPHFDHANIIRYCNRPFISAEEMNNTLLREYHNRVKQGDTVYFLGDMTFGRGSKGARYWLDKLQSRCDAKFYYIKGSHDNDIHPATNGLAVVEVASEKVISVNGEQVLLIHDPAQVDPSWKGWVVHGHVHNYRPVLWKTHHINVSCDAVGFRPVSVNYIVGLIKDTTQNMSKEENNAR